MIASSETGPRGEAEHRENIQLDEAENLILLCPNCHTRIDKKELKDHFPPEKLCRMKNKHEEMVQRKLSEYPSFSTKDELFRFAANILLENKEIHSSFGPESDTARNNPFSESVQIWEIKKVTTVIPNNKKIILAFEEHKNLTKLSELRVYNKFKNHAEMFEQNTYGSYRLKEVPEFPPEFEEMIMGELEN